MHFAGNRSVTIIPGTCIPVRHLQGTDIIRISADNNVEPSGPGSGHYIWANTRSRRGVESKKILGGLFRMFKYRLLSFCFKMAVTVCVTLSLALLGCAAGGRGVSRAQYALSGDSAMESDEAVEEQLESLGYADRSSNMERALSEDAHEVKVPAPEPEEAGTADTFAEFQQDPFGLIPDSWPGDIALHPEAGVAEAEFTTGGGSFLLMLASSRRVTPPGVQDYHLEILSEWESIRVRELPALGGAFEEPSFLIVAERPGAHLEITTGYAQKSLVESLGEAEYWLQRVGDDPVRIRLSFTPVNDSD